MKPSRAVRDTQQEQMLPTGLICRRYNIVDRTIDRWLARGILPKPLRINRYRYWRLSDLERFERGHLGPCTNEARREDVS
jgi:hypothetical protein